MFSFIHQLSWVYLYMIDFAMSVRFKIGKLHSTSQLTSDKDERFLSDGHETEGAVWDEPRWPDERHKKLLSAEALGPSVMAFC